MIFSKSPRVTPEMVLDALKGVRDPELHRDLVTLNMIEDIQISEGEVSFTIALTTPACPLRDQIEQAARAAVAQLPGVKTVRVRLDARVSGDHRIFARLQVPIANIVAVGSGKGGVGKTTVAVNLAVALAQMGAQTGILDADIYGPNVPLMMGVDQMPPPQDGRLVPAMAHNVAVMSIGFLVPQGEALIWRGPMLHSAIRQMFTDVAWQPLDYLIVDLPPGTGDVQLSLAQLVPVTAGIIVTTPQAVALADARRALTAFRRLDVPVLGLIENMAGEVFGIGGGEEAAEKLGVPFLGRVYLASAIRTGGDRGQPIVVAQPASEQAQTFQSLAQQVAGRVSLLHSLQPDSMPTR